MTKLIIFIHQDSGDSGKLFKKAVDQVDKDVSFELYQDFTSFEAHLLRTGKFSKQTLYILFVDSKARLNKLMTFINLLDGRRLLIVGPDKKPETTSKMLKLFPRFLTYLQSDYDDFCAVIKKMISREEEVPSE